MINRKWEIKIPINDLIAAFEQKEYMNTYTLLLIASGQKAQRNTTKVVGQLIAKIETQLNDKGYILQVDFRSGGRKYYYIEKKHPENIWPCYVPKSKIRYCNHIKQCQSGIRGVCKVNERVVK